MSHPLLIDRQNLGYIFYKALKYGFFLIATPWCRCGVKRRTDSCDINADLCPVIFKGDESFFDWFHGKNHIFWLHQLKNDCGDDAADQNSTDHRLYYVLYRFTATRF